MGRKKSNLSGLSRFLGELKQEPAQNPAEEAQPNLGALPTAVGVTRKASELQEDEPTTTRNKKRKVGLLGPGYEKYDATGLAPHYTHISQVPERLKKYFSQRNRYFSLYAEGCLLDEEGWYSVTPELIADQIAERCRCDTIVDAFCGVGGNAIAFAKTCERVIAIDTSPVRLALARHNATIYGVVDRIEFILADYLSFSHSYLSQPNAGARKIDVVFLSPPWGGPEYLSGLLPIESPQGDTHGTEGETYPEYSLASIKPIHGAELFKLSRKITPNIAYFLPRNTNLEEVSHFLDDENEMQKRKGKQKAEMIEVEEEWMGSKLKALTCYFGGLVVGQEDMFEANTMQS